MKYFISNFSGIYLGFPAQQTERIIQVERTQRNICETSDMKTFISIPALLRQSQISAPHGLVLKTSDAECAQLSNQRFAQRAIILLTPKIDIELDIPQEQISKLPAVISGGVSFFNGAFFSDNAHAGDYSGPEIRGIENTAESFADCTAGSFACCTLILLLDTAKIIEYMEENICLNTPEQENIYD